MSEPSIGALSPGRVFHGRYEIVRCLRAGGMGAVYECIHLQTRKHRALKVMLPHLLARSEMRERFELEARVTAEIESDHIVETFDAGVDEQTAAPFLVMELLRGEDLSRVLARRGSLPAGEVILLLSQAALALDKTHAAGIVHRDLKPENLYLTTRDDGSPRLKILDFGIAKVVADANQTVQETAMVGTAVYMPPEQIRGEGTIGARADVYALGHIAFTLLTGRAYWDDEQKTSPAMFVFLEKVVKGLPEPATARAVRRGMALPAAFDAWFARATARSASDRFDRASTLIHELAVVLGVGAPRLAADSGVDSSVSRSSQAARGSDPAGMPEQAGLEAKTEGTSSKSIVSISRRSHLPLALAAIGALVSVVVGVIVAVRLLPGGSKPSRLSAEPSMTAAPEPALLPPSVVPSTSLPQAGLAASSTSATSSPIMKARPLVVKPPGRGQVCDPPYVIDSAGDRHIKPQCL